MVAKSLVLLFTGSYAAFLPKHIALANFNGHFDVNQNSSFCLTTNSSNLVDHEGEEGVFAKCDLPAGTMLGEFKGKVYSTPWQVPNDGMFAWKIPCCDGNLLRRVDTEPWRKCGDNGFNYIDAETMDDARTNPLRFVQQARPAQKEQVNVDLFVDNHKIYYYATKAIDTGKEVIIRADAQNWAHARGWHAGMDGPSQSEDATRGFGSGSSAHSHLAAVPEVPRAAAQTGSKHKTVQAHKVAPVTEASPVKAEAAVEPPVAAAVTAGGISAAPVWND